MNRSHTLLDGVGKSTFSYPVNNYLWQYHIGLFLFDNLQSHSPVKTLYLTSAPLLDLSLHTNKAIKHRSILEIDRLYSTLLTFYSYEWLLELSENNTARSGKQNDLVISWIYNIESILVYDRVSARNLYPILIGVSKNNLQISRSQGHGWRSKPNTMTILTHL